MSVLNLSSTVGTTHTFLWGPIWRADVARLLGMPEVVSSVIMRQQRATDDLRFTEDGTRLFISSIEQCGIFRQRAYLMSLAGLTAGRGAGHQPGEQ
jgi:hypothetical protein